MCCTFSAVIMYKNLYKLVCTNENSLFQSRIGGRYQNFTWSGSALFPPQSNQDYTAVYAAGAISDSFTYNSPKLNR